MVQHYFCLMYSTCLGHLWCAWTRAIVKFCLNTVWFLFSTVVNYCEFQDTCTGSCKNTRPGTNAPFCPIENCKPVLISASVPSYLAVPSCLAVPSTSKYTSVSAPPLAVLYLFNTSPRRPAKTGRERYKSKY